MKLDLMKKYDDAEGEKQVKAGTLINSLMTFEDECNKAVGELLRQGLTDEEANEIVTNRVHSAYNDQDGFETFDDRVDEDYMR